MSHIKLQHTINIKWNQKERSEARRHRRVGIADDRLDSNVVSVCMSLSLFGLGTTVKLSKVPQTDHNMAKTIVQRFRSWSRPRRHRRCAEDGPEGEGDGGRTKSCAKIYKQTYTYTISYRN